ncbi:MAG: NAD(P)/FAD-dependent oxidoreductase [Bryobacteraceae bacterium]
MFFTRVRTVAEVLSGLRRHDFRAARTWIQSFYPGRSLPVRLFLFLKWSLTLIWRQIPETAPWATLARPVSRTPIWLAGPDPFDNHPFAADPDAHLPDRVEVVVIGAGMIGSAAAYHWSKHGTEPLLVLEMNGVASGSAGRNEGLIVMGRYYYYVHATVLPYLARTRPGLDEAQRDALAHEFAEAYCRAAYANAEMIAETVEREGIDCDYTREGWVQAAGQNGLERLKASTRMAAVTGFTDWTSIPAEEVFRRSGMKTPRPAGFSIGAACWHPAKWVWGLMRVALRSPHVRLFTRTKVLRVEDNGEFYTVHTSRGIVRARFVVNATESHTPSLFPEFHDTIIPMQTQAAFGESDGGTMKGGVGISGDRAFYGRHGNGILFGSDATRVPDHEAGWNQPCRFITRFLLTELRPLFNVRRVHVSNEWSGTVSYTPDEFPLVGLMDGKRMYMVGGMAGSGSGVSFNGARHVVQKILGLDGPDYYPEKYFSPARFRAPRPRDP